MKLKVDAVSSDAYNVLDDKIQKSYISWHLSDPKKS